MDIYAFPPVAAILDAAYSGLLLLTDLLEPLAGEAAAARRSSPPGSRRPRRSRAAAASPRACASCSDATPVTASGCSARR
jgi:hypothetical protein